MIAPTEGPAALRGGSPDQAARLPLRLLLVTSALPPERSGVAVVIGRLFGGIHPDDYRLATFSTDGGDREEPFTLQAKTHVLESSWRPSAGLGLSLSSVRPVRNFSGETVRRARALAEVIVAEGCEAVMVVSGATPNLAAAAMAARLTRRPFFVYMFDEWRYQLVDSAIRRAMGVLQPLVLAGSSGVLVPSEPLKRSLERVYGCSCTVVRNPIAASDLEEPPALDAPWPQKPGEIRIVYTGQVYAAQLDSLERILNALQSPRLHGVSLHLYTAQAAEGLRRQGLDGNIEIHPHLAADEIRRVQRTADILLLPLAFASPYPQIIRTAAPGKFGEYLASARPILIHAPRGSFAADFGRRRGIAQVVDEPAPELIVDAIERIAANPDQRRELTARARAVAEREFSIEESRGRLVRLLERIPQRAAA